MLFSRGDDLIAAGSLGAQPQLLGMRVFVRRGTVTWSTALVSYAFSPKSTD